MLIAKVALPCTSTITNVPVYRIRLPVVTREEYIYRVSVAATDVSMYIVTYIASYVRYDV